MIARVTKTIFCHFRCPEFSKGSICANLVLKSIENREIDNIDPNNAFQWLKLLKTVLLDRYSGYKTYHSHIEPCSVTRALGSPNLGKFRAEIHGKKQIRQY